MNEIITLKIYGIKQILIMQVQFMKIYSKKINKSYIYIGGDKHEKNSAI